MSRSITCSNHRGISMTFDEYSFQPFLLAHVEGIYEARNDLIVSKNAMLDGGTYQGSTASIRNILLTVMCPADKYYRQQYRDELYQLFSKGSKGTFTYKEFDNVREATYRVESVEQGAIDKRLFNISLICEDPFFYAVNDTHVELANWEGLFEFVHEFIEDGEEFGYRSEKRLVTIENEFGIDGMGITILVSFNGRVVNPSIVKVEDGTHITLGNSAYPLELNSGDMLRITTGANDKHIYLLQDGVETEINQYLTEDSDFILLTRGENNIGYEADIGVDNIVMDIQYRMQYEGA